MPSPHRAGWRNVGQGTDPTLARTFSSLGNWSAKLGAGCSVAVTSQNIATGGATWAAITWVSAVDDANNFWRSATPTRLTCPDKFDGVYVVTLQARWGTSATAARTIGFSVNGTGAVQPTWVDVRGAGVASPRQQANGSRVLLNAGDYIEAYAHQTSGAVQTLGGFMEITRVGDYHRV